MGIFRNPYRVQDSSANHTSYSPAGTSLLKGIQGSHNFINQGLINEKLFTKKRDPYESNIRRAIREKRILNNTQKAQAFFRKRAEAANKGGTISKHTFRSSLGKIQSISEVENITYEGREALVNRNRLRTQQIRNRAASNLDKVYNKTSNGVSTEKEYRKRLHRRKVRTWKKGSAAYKRFDDQWKQMGHKQRLDFVGPQTQHPGKKPGNGYKNRTINARNYWNTALRDARDNRGTAYTRAAAKASYDAMARKRIENPRTSAGRLRQNALGIAREYKDGSQLRGATARLTSMFEAKAARRAEIASGARKALGPNGLGRGALFTSNKGYTQATTDNLANLRGMKFTEVNYKEPDFFQKTWETIKEKAKPFIEGKVDSANDLMTARFNGMDETASGVRGYGGINKAKTRTAVLDGISELDKGRLPESDRKSPDELMKERRLENLKQKYPLGEMAIRKDNVDGTTKYKPINSLLDTDKLISEGKVLNSIESTAVERGWWKTKEKVKDLLNGNFKFEGSPKYGTPELDRWKKMHRNEAAKRVRNFGDNVDPFHESAGNTHVQRMRDLQNSIRSRIGGDDIKGHFKKQRDKVHQQRAAFYEKLQAGDNKQAVFFNTRHLDSPEWKEFDKQLAYIDRKQAQAERVLNWKNPYEFEHKKTFMPSEGTNGYGLGFGNFMKASRSELGVRGLGFAVGVGGGEALANSFGIMTTNQKLHLKTYGQNGILSKIMTPGIQTAGLAYGSLMYTAMTGGEISEFAINQLSAALGLQGWRVGSSFGGMLGKERLVQGSSRTAGSITNGIKSGVRTGITRGAAGLLGGLTGFAVGVAAVQSAAWAIKDLASNRSTIRKVAKEFSTRTGTIDTGYSKQSLTSKQMALSKLAKSGLNDRAMLLGNEARTMKGLM